MLAIHEKDVPGVSVPGRVLHWVVSREQGLPSDGCTFCVMYVKTNCQPGSLTPRLRRVDLCCLRKWACLCRW